MDEYLEKALSDPTFQNFNQEQKFRALDGLLQKKDPTYASFDQDQRSRAVSGLMGIYNDRMGVVEPAEIQPGDLAAGATAGFGTRALLPRLGRMARGAAEVAAGVPVGDYLGAKAGSLVDPEKHPYLHKGAEVAGEVVGMVAPGLVAEKLAAGTQRAATRAGQNADLDQQIAEAAARRVARAGPEAPEIAVKGPIEGGRSPTEGGPFPPRGPSQFPYRVPPPVGEAPPIPGSERVPSPLGVDDLYPPGKKIPPSGSPRPPLPESPAPFRPGPAQIPEPFRPGSEEPGIPLTEAAARTVRGPAVGEPPPLSEAGKQLEAAKQTGIYGKTPPRLTVQEEAREAEKAALREERENAARAQAAEKARPNVGKFEQKARDRALKEGIPLPEARNRELQDLRAQAAERLRTQGAGQKSKLQKLKDSAIATARSQKGAIEPPASMVRAARTARAMTAGVKRLFSPERELGRAIVSKQHAWAQKYVEDAAAATHEVRRRLGELLQGYPELADHFIDNFEHGYTQATPELEVYDSALRGVLNDMTARIQKLGDDVGLPLLRDFYENYFPHAWIHPETGKTARFVPVGSKGSLSGTGAGLKERTFDWYRDARAEGFVPLYQNPADAVMAKVMEMAKFEKGIRVMDELKNAGMLRFGYHVSPGEGAINDKLARTFMPEHIRTPKPEYDLSGETPERGSLGEMEDPGRMGGTGYRGQWFAPELVAKDINRHLSPGFRRGSNPMFREAGEVAAPGGLEPEINWYDAFRKWTVDSNAFRMGMSAFHVTTTGFNAAVDGLAEGMYQVFRRGDVVRGVKAIAQSPFQGFIDFARGNQGIKQLRGLKDFGPEVQRLVDSYIDSGANVGQSKWYINSHAEEFSKALKEMRPVGMAWHAANSLNEPGARFLFEYLVPRVKMGAFMRKAQAILDDEGIALLSPEAANNHVLTKFSQAQNEIDNIFGQLNYDKLFWNNKWKQALHLGFQAPGWTIGTVRQVVGGVVDPMIGRGFTRRSAYALSLPIAAIGYSMLMEHALTGKVRDNVDDTLRHMWGGFIHSYNPDGSPNWAWLPTYMKDQFHWYNGLADMVLRGDMKEITKYSAGKMNPLVDAASSVAQNVRYPGVQIRNPEDPASQQLKDIGWGVAKTLYEPFTLSNYLRSQQQMSPDSPAALGVLAMTGFAPAPKELSQTRAEKLVEILYAARHPVLPITQKQAAQRDLKGQIVQSMRSGSPVDMVAASKLPPHKLKAAIKQGHQGRFESRLDGLGVPELLKVWQKGKEDEDESQRTVIQRTLQRKLVRQGGRWLADLPDPEDRQRVLSDLNDFLKDVTIQHPEREHVEEKPTAPGL